MKLRINWKKTLLVVTDILLLGYLVTAMVSFNKPDNSAQKCSGVSINIADENTNGFLNAQEVKNILERSRLYPIGKPTETINPRHIEDYLKKSPFVNTAQCYKTQNGHVCITITQRLPIIRVKNIMGDDYYLDERGGILPNSKYTSDLIIATGYIQRQSSVLLATIARELMSSDLWRNQIEQINILKDQGIELIPRVGDHIVYIGIPPRVKNDQEQVITTYIHDKMDRLEKFYKYGLNEAGWNKYHYISLEFDNQIICKKSQQEPVIKVEAPAQPATTPTPSTTPEQPATDNKENKKQV